MADANFIWGTGRRKSAVARVRVRAGTGTVVINGRELADYFPSTVWANTAVAPLAVVGKREGFDVFVKVQGGGLTGQAGAMAMGIARALSRTDRETYYVPLREAGYITRDSRMKDICTGDKAFSASWRVMRGGHGRAKASATRVPQ